MAANGSVRQVALLSLGGLVGCQYLRVGVTSSVIGTGAPIHHL